MAPQKDYYSLLGVVPTATPEEIRSAYMKKALESHPDRNHSTNATREFQTLADAYYTLSDTTRRAKIRPGMLCCWKQNFWLQERSAAGNRTAGFKSAHTDAEDVFGNVFEDLLRPEVGGGGGGTLGAWWSTLGLAAGAVIGFIIANIPGAVVGGFAGKSLGAIRDRSGRPVYDSFKELPHARKAQILAALATQVLGAGSGSGGLK
ncbi:DnaJ-domain-containing protein [Coemansia reversa NRRL 1564]|uniref:DnaJ-domain-containing protein n=1 Tax=Coemansia reversa (strain ATCC 12441 / NRRL 1564) TaxID=763665 RepID=A0A2G5BIU2_COERN|nr:DnaJ-domain-containing protein [Coemansia reversa NRRL 1564]|eukprot:PIA18954.1 DnaJ-domain-containing protein [Coemansia reversa NRRL 1564]